MIGYLISLGIVKLTEELFPKSIFVSAMYFMQTVVYSIQPTDRTTRAQFEITIQINHIIRPVVFPRKLSTVGLGNRTETALDSRIDPN